MKVINSHKRIINQPKERVSSLLRTLASNDDKIWAYSKWPAIRFIEGLKVGSKGGHGPIKYTIIDYVEGNYIRFQFTKPKGFNGTHGFTITEANTNSTEVRHTINMKTSGFATLSWFLVIRWLHDALMEDTLDTLENNFLKSKKTSKWSSWVKLWRWLLKPKKSANKKRLSEIR